MGAIADVREISRIAYGFKASKALLVGIDLGLFTLLSDHAKTLPALAEKTGVATNRLETLLTALTSIGLLVKNGSEYSNAPASDNYLVKGKPAYFGDYFSLQTDSFIYPAFTELGALIKGEGVVGPWRDYESLMQDGAAAERFSRGQHAGSLGPAVALSKQVDLAPYHKLLDVGGGSGAFAIMLCKRNPRLAVTILDFETVRDVAGQFVAGAGLEDRIAFVTGNVITSEWPGGHDAVLMSFLFSAVSEEAIAALLRKAHQALPAGGAVIVHDFMVEDDKAGPPDAALWFLTCMFNCPEGIVLTPGYIARQLEEAGFAQIEIRNLVQGLTKVAVAIRA